MNCWDKFKQERKSSICKMGSDREMNKLGIKFVRDTAKYKYSYNFTWMGAPIIQFPQDLIAMQEIIWSTKPDVIVETGVAHGGSLIFYASMLHLLGEKGKVVGVDIDIREHNRIEIEKHPLSDRIALIQGSSTDPAVLDMVREQISSEAQVLVVLDSNHTHDHVLSELELYSSLVTKGNYIVVFDTAIEDMPIDFSDDRPWGKGDNPKTAVREFLKRNDRFSVDKEMEDKLLVTVCPEGYLKCIR